MHRGMPEGHNRQLRRRVPPKYSITDRRNETQVFLIPLQGVGRVIGTGGTRITSIENNTYTGITIDKNPTVDRKAIVYIMGHRSNIETAVMMLNNILKDEMLSTLIRYGEDGDQDVTPAPGTPRNGEDGEQANEVSGPSQDRRDQGAIPRTHNVWNRPAGSSHHRSLRREQNEHANPLPIPEEEGDDAVAREEMQEVAIGGNAEATVGGNAEAPFADVDFGLLNIEAERAIAEKWAAFPEAILNFYKELPSVSNMTEKEVQEYRKQMNKIDCKRPLTKDGVTLHIPNPVKKFYESFHNHPKILKLLKTAGFKTPTPIQCQAWPILLTGRDMIGIAQTGTGKTLAFLLPALVHIEGQVLQRPEREGPAALVLAPTRELALQIEAEVKKYNYKDIKSVCLYGGVSRSGQIEAIQSGVDIVIATPGRLDDLILHKYITMDYVTYVVLDEADRMLDMGFEPQIRKILFVMRRKRQTVMTSATWPLSVRRLANSYSIDPIQVYVGSLDLSACKQVQQSFVFIDEETEKYSHFFEVCKLLESDQKAIVFVGQRNMANHLSVDLILRGIDCSCIQGQLEQSDREQALKDIRDNVCRILVATDVASRGIDVVDLTHVINFDFPQTVEEYVHRVGRTGRAGRSGLSLTYMKRRDARHARQLIKLLVDAEQFIPRELYALADKHDRQQQYRQNPRRY